MFLYKIEYAMGGECSTYGEEQKRIQGLGVEISGKDTTSGTQA
jgi:hypothetical protein